MGGMYKEEGMEDPYSFVDEGDPNSMMHRASHMAAIKPEHHAPPVGMASSGGGVGVNSNVAAPKKRGRKKKMPDMTVEYVCGRARRLTCPLMT